MSAASDCIPRAATKQTIVAAIGDRVGRSATAATGRPHVRRVFNSASGLEATERALRNTWSGVGFGHCFPLSWS